MNGYVGLPVPAKPAFLKVFRRMINGRRPPEQIYRVHDASHVLTGTTFTHDEPPLVLLAGEAVEQGLYFASRGTPRWWAGCCSTAARSWSAPAGSRRSVRFSRGIRLGLFNRAYDYARRTRLANLFTIPVDELWDLPVAEARRRLGMPAGQSGGGPVRRHPHPEQGRGRAAPGMGGFRCAAVGDVRWAQVGMGAVILSAARDLLTPVSNPG